MELIETARRMALCTSHARKDGKQLMVVCILEI